MEKLRRAIFYAAHCKSYKGGKRMNKMSSIKRNFLRTYGIISVLFLMILIMTIISPTFRTPENATNILRQVSVNGILSVAMTIVILTGGIDLTVGALLAVSGVIAGSILV